MDVLTGNTQLPDSHELSSFVTTFVTSHTKDLDAIKSYIEVGAPKYAFSKEGERCTQRYRLKDVRLAPGARDTRDEVDVAVGTIVGRLTLLGKIGGTLTTPSKGVAEWLSCYNRN